MQTVEKKKGIVVDRDPLLHLTKDKGQVSRNTVVGHVPMNIKPKDTKGQTRIPSTVAIERIGRRRSRRRIRNRNTILIPRRRNIGKEKIRRIQGNTTTVTLIVIRSANIEKKVKVVGVGDEFYLFCSTLSDLLKNMCINFLYNKLCICILLVLLILYIGYSRYSISDLF